ncbi:MAG: hypothetical protein ACRC8S_05210 [Fimbriiglobus sp.]
MPLSMISAVVNTDGDPLDNIACFDPSVILARMRREFPEIEIDPTDYAWRDYKGFLAMGLTSEDSALGVAAADARHRGPLWLFRIPSPDGVSIRGSTERYRVLFHRSQPFPEALRLRLLEFLEKLRFIPCVEILEEELQDNQ